MAITRSLSRPITQPIARAITAAGFGPPPIAAPGAPTIGTATAGNAQASVTFTAPGSIGGGPITGYRVTSSPGGFTGTGAGSPIVVTGLTNGVAYTFTAAAQNAGGYGPESAASNSVTPASNLVTNGTFTGQSPWETDDPAQVSFGIGQMNYTGTGYINAYGYQNLPGGLTAGNYSLTYTIIFYGGAVYCIPKLGGSYNSGVSGISRTGAGGGTFTETINVASGPAVLSFFLAADTGGQCDFAIDNVTLVKL